MSQTTGRFVNKKPVSDALKRRGHWKYSYTANSSWVTNFWDYTLNDTRRAPFWISDFKHRYLIRTGKDHQGPMPAHPPPGSYQGLRGPNVFMYLRDFEPADRETRRLPIMKLTARVYHEHREELRTEFRNTFVANKKIIDEARDVELYNWYTKVQRVRGRWCRDQGVTSRGVYSGAVDAAELWG